MDTVISCVVDRHPKYLAQARTLLLSLRAAGAAPETGCGWVVHAPRDMAGDPRLDALAALGARIAPIVPFGEGPAAYCNKLRQLDSPALDGAGRVILLDADLMVLADPRMFFDPMAIRAKIVDRANPPQELAEALFARAGLPVPGLVAPDFGADTLTPRGNANGGMYMIPGDLLPVLAESWTRWARFCLGQGDLLGRYLHHSDQTGFMLALAETGLPFDPLPVAANFPTHFPASAYAGLAPLPIVAAHYHGNVDAHGLPGPTGVPWIDGQILSGAARLRAALQDA